ncbi:MAG: hypothetical protein JWP94_3305 [Mucilaginibacter sp.]|nr:hypothetical protein [Mucilaginibacter sp.]
MKTGTLLFLLIISCLTCFSQIKHIATEPAKIRNKPEPIGDVVGYINKGDTVLVATYKAGYWNVKCGKVSGFVSEAYFPVTSDIESIRNSDPNTIPTYQWPLTVRLGITKAELVHIIGVWSSKNTTTYGDNQIDEQLIYNVEGEKTKYYYFTNDKLTSIQD